LWAIAWESEWVGVGKGPTRSLCPQAIKPSSLQPSSPKPSSPKLSSPKPSSPKPSSPKPSKPNSSRHVFRCLPKNHALHITHRSNFGIQLCSLKAPKGIPILSKGCSGAVTLWHWSPCEACATLLCLAQHCTSEEKHKETHRNAFRRFSMFFNVFQRFSSFFNVSLAFLRRFSAF
jgi:hypothetical protein